MTVAPSLTAPTLGSAGYADNGVSLSFTAPSVPTGATVTSYDYEISTDGGTSIAGGPFTTVEWAGVLRQHQRDGKSVHRPEWPRRLWAELHVLLPHPGRDRTRYVADTLVRLGDRRSFPHGPDPGQRRLRLIMGCRCRLPPRRCPRVRPSPRMTTRSLPTVAPASPAARSPPSSWAGVLRQHQRDGKSVHRPEWPRRLWAELHVLLPHPGRDRTGDTWQTPWSGWVTVAPSVHGPDPEQRPLRRRRRVAVVYRPVRAHGCDRHLV